MLSEVVVAVIKNDKDEVLIGEVSELKSASFGDIPYVFPGGKVEPGETLPEAVIREVREETGVVVEVLDHISLREHPVTKREIHYFLCKYISGELDVNHPLNDDLTKLLWVSIDSLIQLMPTLNVDVRNYLLLNA